MRDSLRCRGLISVAMMLVCLLGSTTYAQTDAYWLTAADGDWSTATNWSTDPIYPNNDSPTAGDTYDVTLDATGSPYTVTVDEAVTIDNLTLISPEVSLLMSHSMDMNGTVNIQAGVFNVVSEQLSVMSFLEYL